MARVALKSIRDYDEHLFNRKGILAFDKVASELLSVALNGVKYATSHGQEDQNGISWKTVF